MTVRVAINGFGRIGRLTLRAFLEARRKELDFVAINDLGPVETNAHLLRYDSVHGRFPATVTTGADWIDVGRGQMLVTALNLKIGYDNAAKIANQQLLKGVELGLSRVPAKGTQEPKSRPS